MIAQQSRCTTFMTKYHSYNKHNEIAISSRLALLRDSYFCYKRKHGERENRTYPSGEADVIDETENVGRAQVQHGQQGLEKKRLCFQLTSVIEIDGAFNSDRVYLTTTTSLTVGTIYPLDCALVFAESGNHVGQQAGNVGT